MTARHDLIRRPAVKLTSQLTRGDRIRIDGLGGFAVTHAQPFGSKALIRLGWENLAVITARDVRWQAITPRDPIYLHGYQPCTECDGKGIIFATSDQPPPGLGRPGQPLGHPLTQPTPTTGRAPARCPARTLPEGGTPP